MRIKSEYNILSECVERGIDAGYSKARKHLDDPTENELKRYIYDAVTLEICEYFTFDKENYE